MRQEFPRTLEYLGNFEKQLLARKTAPVRQQMSEGLFYAILGIGPYTVSEWKVIFKDLTELFQCCVIGPGDSSVPGKTLIPDCTLRLIPADSEDEAHYIAALLNSSPCVAALYYSSAGVQTQRYHAADAEKVAISLWHGSSEQRKLAKLSKACHAAANKGDILLVQEIEAEIDASAAAYWSIQPKVLTAIQKALDPIKKAHGLYEGIAAASDGEDE
jgi:hypothetical protein